MRGMPKVYIQWLNLSIINTWDRFQAKVGCQSGLGRAAGKTLILPGLELFPGEKENSYNQEEAGDHRSQDDGE